MNVFGGEAQLVGCELARLEELVKEGAPVTLRIVEARNKAADFPLIFDRDLDKFAFTKERVHPGVVLGRGSSSLRFSAKE